MSLSSTLRLVDLGAVATASTTAIHAAFAGDDASLNFPGAFSNPDIPRNLTATFGDEWDGGVVTVVGTDQFDQAISEVFTPGAGTTVVGSKCFKTVTSATKGAVGASSDTCSIGTGVKLGAQIAFNGSRGLVTCDGVSEAGTWDTTNFTVAPTTAPDATRIFLVMTSEPDFCTGSPEGVVIAAPGSTRTDHLGRLWSKASGYGATGWILRASPA